MNEMLRNGLDLHCMQHWLFADTLELFRALENSFTNGCAKLQSFFQHLRLVGQQLAAHRALEDCFALRCCVQAAAAHLGVSLRQLLRPLCVTCAVDACAAQFAVLQ